MAVAENEDPGSRIIQVCNYTTSMNAKDQEIECVNEQMYSKQGTKYSERGSE